MKHYHGTPLGGTRDSVARFIAAGRRHFLVPYSRDEDLPIVAESSAGFCVDNGAFTAWKSGKPVTNWNGYYKWCLDWHRNPRFDFAIIPDVIDGTEEENRALLAEWFQRTKSGHGWVRGAPVWHLHESIDYLKHCLRHFDIVCLGSSGQYATPGTTEWHNRMATAFDAICDHKGRPRRRIHGLRMLDPAIVERYPFYSCDSTNVAQNSQLLGRYGIYKPPSQAQRREVLAARIEAAQSPSVWVRPEENGTLFELK
jgi:hypothetical protein